MGNENFKNKKDTILAIVGILFFVILVILTRSRNVSEKQFVEPTATPDQTQFETENTEDKDKNIFYSIHKNNYHFTYTITEDNKIEIIDGKVNGNKTKFTIINHQKEEYAKVSDSYLKLENGIYTITKSEIRSYFPYISLKNIQDILELSFMEKEENIQIYTIDITDLLDKYTDIEYDGFKEFKDDQIKIYLNGNQEIIKIEIDYSNYFTYIKERTSVFKVTMEFDDFGNIEALET